MDWWSATVNTKITETEIRKHTETRRSTIICDVIAIYACNDFHATNLNNRSFTSMLFQNNRYVKWEFHKRIHHNHFQMLTKSGFYGKNPLQCICTWSFPFSWKINVKALKWNSVEYSVRFFSWLFFILRFLWAVRPFRGAYRMISEMESALLAKFSVYILKIVTEKIKYISINSSLVSESCLKCVFFVQIFFVILNFFFFFLIIEKA